LKTLSERNNKEDLDMQQFNNAGVQYTQFRQDSTTIPAATNQTYTWGENIPSGPLDSLIMRITTVNTTGAAPQDFANLFSSVRFTLNGEVIHDFRQAVSGGANENPSSYGYFLNSIGGRSTEKPSDLTKEAYLIIPVGREIAKGVGRIEAVISYSAAAAAVASGTFQLWGRYNSNVQTQTTVVPATSYTHAIAIEQVVVRIPQDVKGVVAGILVQNQTAADALGSQGIRLMAQSAYGLDVDFIRAFNGDLYNGVLYGTQDDLTQMTFAQDVNGAVFIQTFNLVGGDVVLQVDSTATTTRTYTPVIVAPFGAKETAGVRQTAAVIANTSKSILDRVE